MPSVASVRRWSRGAARCAARRSAAPGRGRRRARRRPRRRCRVSSQCRRQRRRTAAGRRSGSPGPRARPFAAPSAPPGPRRAPRRAPTSSSAASRAPSCSSMVAAGSRKARLATALAIAISTTTIINSISVKPSGAPSRPSSGRTASVESETSRRSRLRRTPSASITDGSLPGADVGILAFAADDAVGAEAVDVDLALQAGVGVLVGRPHGSFGSLSRYGRQFGGIGPAVGLATSACRPCSPVG